MSSKKLDVRERKLVAAKVQGLSHAKAFKQAGYAPNSAPATVRTEATKKVNQPHIQQAIDDALAKQGLTPEWAVNQLGKVAGQDEEMGAKRLASINILELHGWNKQERPTVQLSVKNAFFGGGRQLDETEQKEVIDGETNNPRQDSEE